MADFIQNNGEVPTLAAVLVGDDPASEVYVRNKVTGCERVGIKAGCIACRPTSRKTTCWR